MMACLHVLKEKPPELVLSGVNWGSNLADDVTYSGTIAGAMEGCALGIPSVALSQAGDEESREEIDWSPGEMHGPGSDPPADEGGLARRHADEHQFSRLRRRRGERLGVVPQGRYDLQSTEIEERRDASAPRLLLDRPAPPQSLAARRTATWAPFMRTRSR